MNDESGQKIGWPFWPPVRTVALVSNYLRLLYPDLSDWNGTQERVHSFCTGILHFDGQEFGNQIYYLTVWSVVIRAIWFCIEGECR